MKDGTRLGEREMNVSGGETSSSAIEVLIHSRVQKLAFTISQIRVYTANIQIQNGFGVTDTQKSILQGTTKSQPNNRENMTCESKNSVR